MTDEKNKQMPWKKYHLRLSMYSDDDILTFKGHIDTSKPDPRLGTFLENGYFITEKEAEEFMRLREEKLIIDSGFREIEEAKHAGNNLDVAINKASEVLAEAPDPTLSERVLIIKLVEEFKKSQVKK